MTPTDIGLSAVAGTAAFIIAAPLWMRRRGSSDSGSLLRLFGTLMAVAHAVLLISVVIRWEPMLALGLLLASRALYGIAAAGLMPTAQAIIVQSTAAADRAAGLARLGAGLSAGRILGSLVALAAPLGPAAPFVLLALSPLAAFAAPRGQGLGPVEGRERLSPLDARLAPFLAAATAMTACIGMMQIVLGLLLQARFGLDAAAAASITGALYAGLGVVMIIVQLGIAHRRLPGKPMALLGLALVGAGAILVILPLAIAVLMAGVVLAGVGAAVAAPFAAAWASSRLDRSEQRAAAGWLATVQVAGQGIGAGLGAVLFALWPALPFVLSAAVAIAAVAGMSLLKRPGGDDLMAGSRSVRARDEVD